MTQTKPAAAPEESILLLQSRAAGRRLLAALAANQGLLLGVRAETPYSLALELAVFAMTNRFKEDQLQTSAGLCVTLPDATADHRTLVLAAVDACRRLYKPGYAYKKAGVVITRLVQAEGHTRSLFEDSEAVRREASLSGAIDRINRSYGPGAILFGIQGDGRVKNARDHQSPHYTTLWEDLPKVKVE